jgi:hypothetical protein
MRVHGREEQKGEWWWSTRETRLCGIGQTDGRHRRLSTCNTTVAESDGLVRSEQHEDNVIDGRCALPSYPVPSDLIRS